jgi:LCP family protein required for cell wall assembly
VTSDDSTYEVPISDDVYNILLLGSDTRVSGEVGRSDAMILVSINQKTETIYLTSFLRDSYVYIPGYGNTRLNHSFAYGGPALVEETLETNFKIHIDRYVAVDFYSFMDVVDTLGGVWIDVTEDEQKVTNQYIWSMNKLMGEEWSNDYLWTNGWMKLNGKQALCYARNRYTGNDYERTQRQRTIISQIINGAKESSPSTLVDLAQVILPQVTTDMTKSEILSYCANIAAYVNYDIVQQQIPVDGSYSGATISGMSVISLNLDKNIQYLQSTIYAGTEYGN